MTLRSSTEVPTASARTSSRHRGWSPHRTSPRRDCRWCFRAHGLTLSHVTPTRAGHCTGARRAYKSKARVVQRRGRVNVSMRFGCWSHRWPRRYDAPPRRMHPRGGWWASPLYWSVERMSWGPAPGQCDHSGSMAWRHRQALGQRLVDAERFVGHEGHCPWIGAIRSFY